MVACEISSARQQYFVSDGWFMSLLEPREAAATAVSTAYSIVLETFLLENELYAVCWWLGSELAAACKGVGSLDRREV